MATLFFYGTLRDAPLLEIVLGRAVDTVPARLPGHAVHRVGDAPFPTITSAQAEQAEGVLIDGLSDEDRSRLDFYEGGFAYTLRTVTVDTGDGPRPAQVYFPDEDSQPKGAPWVLADWQARWGEVSRRAAQEVMARYGHQSAEEVATLLPFFRNRAWSQIIAAEGAPQTLRSGMGLADVEVQEIRRGHDGFFRLRPFTLRYRTFDGNWGRPLDRECFVAFDVVLVLPYDPATDHVMVIEQLRFGPIHRGDPAPWVLEPVAGMIDAGETPEEAARRETEEEARLALTELRPVARGYASPGYTTEFYHSFIGLCDLSGHDAPGRGGLASEHEDIRTHVLPLDDALALIETGEINAVPLQMLLFHLAARRAGLRPTP